MAAALAFFTQQLCTEACIHPYIRLNNEGIAVLHTVWDIITHIASIDQVQVKFKILVGRQVFVSPGFSPKILKIIKAFCVKPRCSWRHEINAVGA